MRKINKFQMVLVILLFIGTIAAIISGCILGGFSISVLLCILGIVSYGISMWKKIDILSFISYFCYIGAGCRFIAEQLYTISNVMTAIDATSFSTPFIVSAVCMGALVVLGFIVSVAGMENNK